MMKKDRNFLLLTLGAVGVFLFMNRKASAAVISPDWPKHPASTPGAAQGAAQGIAIGEPSAWDQMDARDLEDKSPEQNLSWSVMDISHTNEGGGGDF